MGSLRHFFSKHVRPENWVIGYCFSEQNGSRGGTSNFMTSGFYILTFYFQLLKLRCHRMRQRHIFLCNRSHQQRNNVIDLIARYKIRYWPFLFELHVAEELNGTNPLSASVTCNVYLNFCP